ncbi:branched-chain amino acid ABC transporter permease [Pseudooceanicola spongiae]|jgi:branched-chain amino acid transport system permease protein|uniref:Branched-chain amino acid ABC transporter permease n=1 Tax=Pseudooceanicola spongiae TaxID=2613965 RepID=A0A7L9WSL9_9RHOB|nr:branched-chain amino acid ABC transporter permease [Pseudooceanicola spongiae]QOL82518.1 branched-chain amino acid ABC transporter permease [Pseudooceanicola spongiae]
MNITRETVVNSAVLALLVLVPVVAQLRGDPFTITLATKVAIFALAGVGLNLALGFGGLISFGHAAFFGIGGYVTGILASHAANYEPLFDGAFTVNGTQQMLLIWPIAIVVAGLFAVVIGALSLRTSGVFFIMLTLAFSQMIYYFAVSWPSYGGEDGLSFYTRNQFPELNMFDPLNYFWVCFTLLILAVGLSAMITRSRFGLALGGARQNPQRMASIGIRPFWLSLTIFVISAMMTALAGSLYADLNRFVSPAMLNWHMSGEIMVFVILGGNRRLLGPVAGAGLYILAEHLLGQFSDYWQFFLGLVLLAVVLFAPGGVIGILTRRRGDV